MSNDCPVWGYRGKLNIETFLFSQYQIGTIVSLINIYYSKRLKKFDIICHFFPTILASGSFIELSSKQLCWKGQGLARKGFLLKETQYVRAGTTAIYLAVQFGKCCLETLNTLYFGFNPSALHIPGRCFKHPRYHGITPACNFFQVGRFSGEDCAIYTFGEEGQDVLTPQISGPGTMDLGTLCIYAGAQEHLIRRQEWTGLAA